MPKNDIESGYFQSRMGWPTVLAALVGLSGCLTNAEREDVARQSEPVSLGLVTLSESSTSAFVNVVTTSSNTLVAQSMAAIRTPGGNCGATFISKHYAITAAHCLPHDEAYYLNSPVYMESYQTGSLNLSEVFNASIVSGTSDMSTWTINNRLSSSEGYNETLMFCKLKRRCYSPNPINCPISPDPFPGTDIALVECPYRVDTSWIPIETGDPTTGAEVEAWWFHEILALQQFSTQYLYTSPPGNFAHYGNALADDNFHYDVGTFYHQLIPLRSRTNSAGTKYKITSNAATRVLWTDMLACHGTSGSGALLWGYTSVAGPVLNANLGTNTGGQYLCHNPGDLETANQHTAFLRPHYTRFFNVPEVLNDR